MAISFVAAANGALPSGIQANDILICQAASAGSSSPGSHSLSAGWTQIAQYSYGPDAFGSYYARISMWWKRATGSDTAPTVTGSSNWGVSAWRGCSTSDPPYEAVSSQLTASSGRYYNFANTTTTAANEMVVSGYVAYQTGTVGAQPTSVAFGYSLGSNYNWQSYSFLASAGSSGFGSITGQYSGSSAGIGFAFALKPPPPVTNASATDSASASDSATGTKTMPGAGTDSASATDSAAGTQANPAAATDSASVSDSADATVTAPPYLMDATDSANAADSADAQIAFAAPAIDSALASDSTAVVMDWAVDAPDTALETASAAATASHVADATDSASLIDSFGLDLTTPSLIAIGSSVAASTDGGVNWTNQATLVSSYGRIVWNGSIFCAVSQFTAKAATSSNGVDWTERSAPAAYYGLCWNGSIFAAVGDHACATSPDGITWTTRTIPAGYYNAVAWSGSAFVAVGYSGGTPYAASSSDGITWTARTIPAATWEDVVWNGSLFCAISDQYYSAGWHPSNIAATSPDGVTWTQRTIPAAHWERITWNGSIFCAVAYDGTVAATSANGTSWTSRTIPSGDYEGLVWDGTRFCAVGVNVAATSTDGITWTSHSIPAGSWYALAFGSLRIGAGLQLYASATDSCSASDSADGSIIVPVTYDAAATDSCSVSDGADATVTLPGSYFDTATDSATVSDTADAILAHVSSASDSAFATDTALVAIPGIGMGGTDYRLFASDSVPNVVQTGAIPGLFFGTQVQVYTSGYLRGFWHYYSNANASCTGNVGFALYAYDKIAIVASAGPFNQTMRGSWVNGWNFISIDPVLVPPGTYYTTFWYSAAPGTDYNFAYTDDPYIDATGTFPITDGPLYSPGPRAAFAAQGGRGWSVPGDFSLANSVNENFWADLDIVAACAEAHDSASSADSSNAWIASIFYDTALVIDTFDAIQQSLDGAFDSALVSDSASAMLVHPAGATDSALVFASADGLGTFPTNVLDTALASDEVIGQAVFAPAASDAAVNVGTFQGYQANAAQALADGAVVFDGASGGYAVFASATDSATTSDGFQFQGWVLHEPGASDSAIVTDATGAHAAFPTSAIDAAEVTDDTLGSGWKTFWDLQTDLDTCRVVDDAVGWVVHDQWALDVGAAASATASGATIFRPTAQDSALALDAAQGAKLLQALATDRMQVVDYFRAVTKGYYGPLDDWATPLRFVLRVGPVDLTAKVAPIVLVKQLGQRRPVMSAPIRMKKNDSQTISFHLADKSGALMPISGFLVSLAAKRNLSDAQPAFTVPAFLEPDGTTATLQLDQSVTGEVGSYYWAISAVQGSEIHTLTGVLIIEDHA